MIDNAAYYLLAEKLELNAFYLGLLHEEQPEQHISTPGQLRYLLELDAERKIVIEGINSLPQITPVSLN
jgi:hypothetical protein